MPGQLKNTSTGLSAVTDVHPEDHHDEVHHDEVHHTEEHHDEAVNQKAVDFYPPWDLVQTHDLFSTFLSVCFPSDKSCIHLFSAFMTDS